MNQKLTPKQRKFADNYIKSGNATQSAIGAGYSRQTAAVIGAENLTKPYIKSYIDEHMAEIASKRIMDATEAVELLTSIARGETKETVYISAADGVYEKHKEADLKTRINATKEILKRYPDNNKLVEQQIRKLKAEADIMEAKAKREVNGDGTDNVNVNIIVPNSTRSRMIMSDITIDIPKIVSPAYYPMFTSHARYLSYKGSRGSGKSVAAARKVIVDILSHSYVNWLVIRQYFGTHKDSTFAALKKAASDLGVYDLFKFTVSPLEVTYKPTGQKIFFRGLTNQPTLNLVKTVKD